MKSPRLHHDKYANRCNAAAVLLKLTRPNLADILNSLEQNLGADEVIHIRAWHDEFFYIEVEDLRYRLAPAARQQQCAHLRVGLTVDVMRDNVVWSNVPYLTVRRASRLPLGGNCYVRANKWKKVMRRCAPELVGFNVYKDVSLNKYVGAHLTQVA